MTDTDDSGDEYGFGENLESEENLDTRQALLEQSLSQGFREMSLKLDQLDKKIDRNHNQTQSQIDDLKEQVEENSDQIAENTNKTENWKARVKVALAILTGVLGSIAAEMFGLLT